MSCIVAVVRQGDVRVCKETVAPHPQVEGFPPAAQAGSASVGQAAQRGQQLDQCAVREPPADILVGKMRTCGAAAVARDGQCHAPAAQRNQPG